MTQALPVTSISSEIVKGMDVNTACNLLCKQGVDVSVKTSIDQARQRLQNTCVEIIRAAKGGDRRSVSGYSVPQAPVESEDIPENLELLPLYTLAMMKNVAFRGGTDVHPDERIRAHHLINQMWLDTSKRFIYPRLFALHSMGPGAGHPADGTADYDDDKYAGRARIELPATVSLSVDSLSSDGIYLLDNAVDMYIWAGRHANPSILNSLFGVSSLENVDPNSIFLQTSGDQLASRVGAIVHSLRESPGDPYVVSSKVYVVREGDQFMESRFFWFLVEDAASFQGGTFSYEDFMRYVNNPGGPVPPGGAPPGPAGMAAPRAMPPGAPRAGPPGPIPHGYGAAAPQPGQGGPLGPPQPSYAQPAPRGPPPPAAGAPPPQNRG
jgi:protein transport protein SEC24